MKGTMEATETRQERGVLRLTTTEAYSVVLEALAETKPVHLPAVDEVGVFVNEAGSWSGYIHGEAERDAGFDIPKFISGTLPDHWGEIPCVLVLPGKEIACTLIQWPGDGKPWDWRALICANTDRDGLNYARRCFHKRTVNL